MEMSQGAGSGFAGRRVEHAVGEGGRAGGGEGREGRWSAAHRVKVPALRQQCGGRGQGDDGDAMSLPRLWTHGRVAHVRDGHPLLQGGDYHVLRLRLLRLPHQRGLFVSLM